MNIKRMAEMAGMTRRQADHQCRVPYWDVVIDPELEHFAALVLEEAAKVCEAEKVDVDASGNKEDEAFNAATEHCAASIRALKGAKK